jgi:deoxyribonuclease V
MIDLHRWDLTPAEARELQTELAAKIDFTTPLDTQTVRRVLAVDVSMNRFATWLAAAAVVCDVNEKMLVESSTLIQPIRFPYVTGLLAFREVPALLKAIERLSQDFDAVVVDGQGLAHPRSLGIACHLGLWLDKPTIGLAKTKLSGTHEPVPNKTGASVPLMLDDRQIGVA